MSRALGNYNAEYFEAAKELYLGGMSLQNIANDSTELLGMPIAYDQLNAFSVKNKWVIAKGNRTPSVKDDDIKYQVDTLRNIVFNQLVAESESELLLFLGEEQRDLVIDFLKENQIEYKDFTPRGVDPQLVNAFMGLLTKSKDAGIENLGKTAKTSRQQVIEEVRKSDEGRDE